MHLLQGISLLELLLFAVVLLVGMKLGIGELQKFSSMTLRCTHLGNKYSFSVSYASTDALIREAVNEILSKYVGKTLLVPLCQLHTVDGFNSNITTMSGAHLNNLQDMWNKERDRKQSDLFHRFDEIYTDFISNVIAPSLKGGMMLINYQLTHSLVYLHIRLLRTDCLPKSSFVTSTSSLRSMSRIAALRLRLSPSTIRA